MSNILRIRTLTDRFLEGETTLEEERELYAFYRSEEVPDDLLSLRPLFVGLEEIQLETPSITPKKKKGDSPASIWYLVVMFPRNLSGLDDNWALTFIGERQANMVTKQRVLCFRECSKVEIFILLF